VTINGEKREEPAKFALDAGHYEILAELEGYAPEHRSIDLEKGFDRVQEIAFRKKLPGPAPRPEKKPGKLSVRTTPYSIVYAGGKKLGEAPFAEMELPAGTYTLTLKNPEHKPVTRTVTITPGKLTKLSVVIP
jgi:serine/threonine-protein kinase